MSKGNYLVAAVGLVLSAVLYYFAGEFEPIVDDAPGPGFMPKILAIAMSLLSLALIGQTLMARRGKPASAIPDFRSPAMLLIYRMMACCLGYAVLVALVGFMFATLAYLPAGMYLMGERSKKHMLAVGIAVTAACIVVFGMFFGMPLPAGLLFE